jgi:hypothetical protein
MQFCFINLQFFLIYIIIKEMADTDIANYVETLQQVLIARKEWLEKSEMGKLKDYLRTFQTSFLTLYNIYLKKKLIDEDPYKHETKITEIEVPDSSIFQEAKRIEQVSIRLSNFDNQLDFLVNFYQLGMDFLNLDRVKRIVGLVRYVDWVNLVPDNAAFMTKSVVEVTNQSKAGADTLTINIIGECLSKLSKNTSLTMNILKELNVYYREYYKLTIRQNITASMSANEATMDNIRKKISSIMHGEHFYKELIDEIIKEDYSSSGADLRDNILNSLKVAEEKQKNAKPAVNFKAILMDGIQVIGGAAISLGEIGVKLDDNQTVMESHKKGFFETIKDLIRQITNAPPEDVIYNIEYFDPAKSIQVKEKINFHQFRDEMTKKIKILNSFVRGSAYNKLAAMSEEQIISYLDKNIRDVQNFHKILSALDDFFKANVVLENRDKIKGIKPELSALKNSIVKANQSRHDYSAQKEEDEQMKRLGIGLSPGSAAPAAAVASPSPAVATPPAAATPAAKPAAAKSPAAAATPRAAPPRAAATPPAS